MLMLGEARSPRETALVEAIGRGARRDPAWRWTAPASDVAAAAAGPGPYDVQYLETGPAVLVGELARGSGVGLNAMEPLLAAEPRATFAAAARQGWGRYVMAQRGRDGRWAVFRDPMGGVDCLIWRQGALTFVASELPAWLEAALPDDLAVDDARLAGYLREPASFQADLALTAITALHPGHMAVDGDLTRLWSPGQVARAGGLSRAEGRRRLPEVAFATVEALARTRGAILAEVSGGLDSSIVAAALQAAAAPVVDWLNIRAQDPMSDERRYAVTVTDRIGAALTCREKPPGRIDLTSLAAANTGLRPNLNGLDDAYDRLVAERGREVQADCLFTGQGGDTVFFHPPTALIAADHLQARGLPGLLDGTLADLARWRRRSVWPLVLGAFQPGRLADPTMTTRPLPFADIDALRRAEAVAPHPWLADLADIAPAKRLQIHSLALTQRMIGASRRGAVLDLVHPLLAQPVVELCMALTTADLTAGGRDRGLARQAFAEHLPDAVRERRSKGDGTAYFGKMVAASLPELRALLLDGELVRRGLLDRVALEARLQPEQLLWHGGYPEFMDAAALELWAAHWTRQIAERAASRRRAG